MAKTATHLYDHDVIMNPFILDITSTKRVKIFKVDRHAGTDVEGEEQYIYCPQWRNESVGITGTPWHNFITNRKAWASFTMDGALAKLGVRPTGLWRVYILDPVTDEVVGTYDRLQPRKPTVYARHLAGVKTMKTPMHYEIIPIV